MAFGTDTISGLSSAVSDVFAAQGDELKARGSEFEKEAYQSAAGLALQNEQFTAMSTAIKASQADRALFTSLGTTRADIAGAGLAASGSALDILRSSAQQGAMTRAVIGQQGLITEAGYQEQASSYQKMASAADVAIQADRLAEKGSYVAAGFAAAGALFSLAPTPGGGGGGASPIGWSPAIAG